MDEGAPDLRYAVDKTRHAQIRTVVPTDEEMRLLRQTADPVLRFMVAAGAEAGLRFGTAVALRPCDIVAGHIHRESKGGSVMKVPLTAELRRAIAAVPSGTPPHSEIPFVNLLSGRTGNLHSLVRRRMRKWIVDSGCRPELVYHDLRRGIARRLYHETRDVRVVQSFLGHQNSYHTMGYLHIHGATIVLDSLQAAVDGPTRA